MALCRNTQMEAIGPLTRKNDTGTIFAIVVVEL